MKHKKSLIQIKKIIKLYETMELSYGQYNTVINNSLSRLKEKKLNDDFMKILTKP